MTKGQIFSGDFMVSLAVFLFVLALIVPLFTKLSEQQRQASDVEDLQTKLSFVTDYLIKGSGVPENWNASNVKAVGFGDGDRINKTKIRIFMGLAGTEAKNFLGLDGYEFNLTFFASTHPLMTGAASSPAAYFYDTEKDLFHVLNGSGLVWDLYANATIDGSDARSVFTGPKASVFNSMTGNHSKYNTIIIENPTLTKLDVNVSALAGFVSSGGILIYEGDADIISSDFSMSFSRESDNGISTGDGLLEAAQGSTVIFSNPDWYSFESQGDADLTIVVEDDDTPGNAFAGYWNHGVGRVYYVTDINGTVNGKNLSGSMGLVGNKAEYFTGYADTVVVSNRAVVYDTDLNSLGRMVMVIGK